MGLSLYNNHIVTVSGEIRHNEKLFFPACLFQ